MTWRHKLTNAFCLAMCAACLAGAVVFFVGLAWKLGPLA